MCAATVGGLSLEGIDMAKETVIQGTVTKVKDEGKRPAQLTDDGEGLDAANAGEIGGGDEALRA